MQNILFIGYNFYPELTGIGKYSSELAFFLRNKKNIETHVITGVPYYPQWKIYEGYANRFRIENIKGVKVFRVPLFIPETPSGMKRIIKDLFFLVLAFLRLNLLMIRGNKYEMVFIPAPSFLFGLLGIYYRAFYKKTLIINHIQDLQVNAAENLGMINNKWLLNLSFRLEKYILTRVDYVSTISVGMQKKILEKSDLLNSCILFPNWINSEVIYPIARPKLIDPRLKGKKVLFYSGAIGEKQGLELMIDVAELFKQNNEILFIISGEGPYKKVLETYAITKQVDNVLFYNLLPIEDFNTMLNAAFVHLIIQKDTGSDLFLPSKLTNILGVGGCVIVTASEGSSLFEIITANKCGIIIQPDNLSGLVESISRLLTSEIEYLQLKQNALQYAKKYLYQDTIIENFLHAIT